jgi:hypothetical protein
MVLTFFFSFFYKYSKTSRTQCKSPKIYRDFVGNALTGYLSPFGHHLVVIGDPLESPTSIGD